MSKLLIEIVKTMGKALIAGVGVEMARVAGAHLSNRLGPKKGDKAGAKDAEREPTAEELRAENERLRAELAKLREELASSPAPAADG